MPPFTGIQAWMLTVIFLCLAGVDAQRNTCPAGSESIGARCIQKQGTTYASPYCSSVLSITTPVVTETTTTIDTTTEEVTTTTGFDTIPGTPPVTVTSAGSTTVSSTTTVLETSTVVTGTFTSFVGTTTSTFISISNVYTCGGSTSAGTTNSSSPTSSTIGSSTITPIFTNSSTIGSPTSTFLSSSSMLNITSSPTLSTLPTSYSSSRFPSSTTNGSSCETPTTTLLEKRQAFPTPRCLRRYSRTYGLDGISDACDCLALATPVPSTTTVIEVDPLTTVTSTSTIGVVGTTAVTPSVTSTSFATSTILFTESSTITTSLAVTFSATATVTETSTSFVTTSSPIPTNFNVYYIDSASNVTNAPSNFFKAVEAPGGSGIVLSSEAGADSFTLDALNRLVDTTGGNAFIAKNSEDLYPFNLLQTTAPSADTPTCTACDGALQCDYPGSTGNTFALCYGYLALGPPGVFGADSDENGAVDCSPITLQFK